ncbi:hypothetical protein DPMN_108132 [Dreissena polymorpha]|uniref:Uncharacterized protein n=1 Tax=Dreissena polymorpha TaxID=45954 RepID=A0A9D4QLQ3_DREPO|nr:hypothetical protein DPMN_108132 [Dreissena polymorpha]
MKGARRSKRNRENRPSVTDNEEVQDIFDTCPDMQPTYLIDSGEQFGCSDSKQLSNPPAMKTTSVTVPYAAPPKSHQHRYLGLKDLNVLLKGRAHPRLHHAAVMMV